MRLTMQADETSARALECGKAILATLVALIASMLVKAHSFLVTLQIIYEVALFAFTTLLDASLNFAGSLSIKKNPEDLLPLIGFGLLAVAVVRAVQYKLRMASASRTLPAVHRLSRSRRSKRHCGKHLPCLGMSSEKASTSSEAWRTLGWADRSSTLLVMSSATFAQTLSAIPCICSWHCD